jgi:hypothetical protein
MRKILLSFFTLLFVAVAARRQEEKVSATERIKQKRKLLRYF